MVFRFFVINLAIIVSLVVPSTLTKGAGPQNDFSKDFAILQIPPTNDIPTIKKEAAARIREAKRGKEENVFEKVRAVIFARNRLLTAENPAGELKTGKVFAAEGDVKFGSGPPNEIRHFLEIRPNPAIYKGVRTPFVSFDAFNLEHQKDSLKHLLSSQLGFGFATTEIRIRYFSAVRQPFNIALVTDDLFRFHMKNFTLFADMVADESNSGFVISWAQLFFLNRLRSSGRISISSVLELDRDLNFVKKLNADGTILLFRSVFKPQNTEDIRVLPEVFETYHLTVADQLALVVYFLYGRSRSSDSYAAFVQELVELGTKLMDNPATNGKSTLRLLDGSFSPDYSVKQNFLDALVTITILQIKDKTIDRREVFRRNDIVINQNTSGLNELLGLSQLLDNPKINWKSASQPFNVNELKLDTPKEGQWLRLRQWCSKLFSD